MMTFVAHLSGVTVSEALDRGLRLNSNLATSKHLTPNSALLPTLNCLTTIGYLLEGYGYLPWSRFLLLLGAIVMETQSFIVTFSWVHDLSHTQSLVSIQ